MERTKLPMLEADIVSKVNTQYDESIELTRNKRAIMERRKKLYLWIKDQEDKSYVRLVYATVDTLQALEANDIRSVAFSGRKFGMEQYANNINNKAKFDWEQMKCFKKKQVVRQDKFMTWAWLEVMDCWDKTLTCPIYKVISPMVRCPDWFADVNNWPRYQWFEFQALRSELEDDERYFNKDQMLSSEQMAELTRRDAESTGNQRAVNLTPITISGNDIIDLYYHYFMVKWKPYLAVLSNERSVLVRFEEIPAMTDIEKEDPSKIGFPVIVRNRRPLRYDPFGLCVSDLLEDKESMIQLFTNLAIIKAQHEAYGDMFMFDPDKIDINNLTIPTMWTKYIPVTWMWEQQYPVMQEVARAFNKPDQYNIVDIIQQQWQMAIGMDNQTLWVAAADNITATENQRVQANANLRILLWIKNDNEAEKEFWTRWYKYNLYYFEDSKEKRFKLNDSVWEVYYSVKKKDFMWITDIDVEIKAQSEIDAEMEKQKVWFTAVADYVLNNPNSTQSGKNFALRELLKVNRIPQEKINMMVKPTLEEIRAVEDLEDLNNNEDVWPIEDLNEDHRTYIIIYDRAFDTDAKWRAISKRRMAIEMSWQNTQVLWETGGNGAMKNMAVNNMLQQDNKTQNQTQSLQTIGR